MTNTATEDRAAVATHSWLQHVAVLARVGVGGMFAFLACKKLYFGASLPGFDKVLKDYHFLPLDPPWMLHSVTVYVPHLELLLGVLLVLGLFQRAAFVICTAMLVVFTALVWSRGLELQAAKDLVFCAVEFDCGCGNGVVNVCNKLAENGALLIGSIIGVIAGTSRWSIDALRARRA